MITRYADVHRLTRDRSLKVSIDLANPTPSIEAERERLGTNDKAGQSMLRKDDDEIPTHDSELRAAGVGCPHGAARRGAPAREFAMTW
jgi:hypothetical protein